MVLDAVRVFRPGPEILVRRRWVPPALAAELATYDPKTHLGRAVKACFRHLPPEQARDLLDRVLSCVVVETSLALVVIRQPDSPFGRGRYEYEDYGVVCRKVVTDTGVGGMVDAFQNLIEPEAFNFHGIGTGGTAEAAGQTALVTELTTQYNPDGTRATGTQSEPASNQYRSTGTNTVDATAAITEHGLFNSATGGAGVMLDRSLFSVNNLASGDALQSTWTLTLTSGG